MAWIFSSERPIYQQIAEHIRVDIIRGRYRQGERLPSVRELAAEAAVNPNTMQRALAELEESGIVGAQRTSGRFVTEDSEVLEKIKKQVAMDLAGDFVKKIRGIGYTLQEGIELLQSYKTGDDHFGDRS